MAIAIEASSINSATAATSVTVPAITPAGSGRHVIGLAGNSSGSLAAYSDMTFGGNQMTAKVNITNPNYIRGVAEELNAPAASSQSLVYTVAASQDELIAAVIALSGVDGTTPTDTYQTTSADTGDPMSVTVTVDSDGLGVAWFYGICATIDALDTDLREVENIGGGVSAAMATKAGTASSMTCNRGGITLNDHIGIAVNVNIAAAGAAGDFVLKREYLSFKPLTGLY